MASINEMPVAAKLGIVLGVAILITAVLYFAVFKSVADQNEADAKTLASKQAEIAQLTPYQNKLTDLTRSIDGLKQQLELQKHIVPDEKEAENFIKMMQAEAQKANVEIRRYTANPVVAREYYSEAPYLVDIDGPYYAVLDFFQRVSKMERIVNVSDLSMASVSKPGGAKLKRTYKYEPNETVVVNCITTTFFSRDTTASAPATKTAGK